MAQDKIEIENVNSPGRTERVDRTKYEAMRAAVLPDAAPGLTVPEAKAALLALLPDALFPAGDKAGWSSISTTSPSRMKMNSSSCGCQWRWSDQQRHAIQVSAILT